MKSTVAGMHLGARHSTVLLESGRVCMLGSNDVGQLGTGDRKLRQTFFQLGSQAFDNSQAEVSSFLMRYETQSRVNSRSVSYSDVVISVKQVCHSS